MPSVSEKQRRFMAAAAHNAAFAKEAGIPQSVAQEFHAADRRSGAAQSGAAHRQIAHAMHKRGMKK